MKITQTRSQLDPPDNALLSPDVLSDFYIKNHHCLVIRPASQADVGEAVGQIRLNNQLYIVKEIDENLDKNSESDVANLLTARELQIVQLIAQGYVNKQVAHQLQISEWTVSTHLRRVFAKLGVDSRAAMVYRCALWLTHQERRLK